MKQMGNDKRLESVFYKVLGARNLSLRFIQEPKALGCG